MQLVERAVASHWYLPDGTPFHETTRSDGKGTRPTTLADARRALALPSVTNVLGIISKPGLEAWKIEQGIMAALTLPRQPEEALDVFARRVVEDMGEQVQRAADLGTEVHHACEVYAARKEVPSDPLILPLFAGWQRWFDENVERVEALEKVLVHREEGYAGRVDLIAKVKGIGWAVIDFKTQKVKRSAKGEPRPAFYETWPLQLAAYRLAYEATEPGEIDAIVSIVIDSTEAGPVHVKVWEDWEEHLATFRSALALWKAMKAYDPSSWSAKLGPGNPLN